MDIQVSWNTRVADVIVIDKLGVVAVQSVVDQAPYRAENRDLVFFRAWNTVWLRRGSWDSRLMSGRS